MRHEPAARIWQPALDRPEARLASPSRDAGSHTLEQLLGARAGEPCFEKIVASLAPK